MKSVLGSFGAFQGNIWSVAPFIPVSIWSKLKKWPSFKKRWHGWSKSIVLENKVAINFDFRSGAKKSGHLDYPLQSYGPKQVRLISTQP